MHGYVLLQPRQRDRFCSAVISLPLSGTHTLCPWVLQMTFFCGKQPGVAPVFLFSNTKARLARSRSGSKKLDHRCCLTRIGRQTKHSLISTPARLSRKGIQLRFNVRLVPLLCRVCTIMICRAHDPPRDRAKDGRVSAGYHDTHDPEIPEKIFEMARRLSELGH